MRWFSMILGVGKSWGCSGKLQEIFLSQEAYMDVRIIVETTAETGETRTEEFRRELSQSLPRFRRFSV